MNVSTIGYGNTAGGKEGKTPQQVQPAKTTASPGSPKVKEKPVIKEPKTLVMKKLQETLSKSMKLRPHDTILRIDVHKQTKTIIVKIVDTKTGQVLLEVPPEKLLNMSINLQELAGALLDRKG